MLVSRTGILTRSNAIGNWFQCRDVTISGENDGSICEKWRRTPLFAVQSDKWECFSSVLWDLTHADCSVPQELETEEVLKQLKYVETVKTDGGLNVSASFVAKANPLNRAPHKCKGEIHHALCNVLSIILAPLTDGGKSQLPPDAVEPALNLLYKTVARIRITYALDR